jgi:hypothetical protein
MRYDPQPWTQTFFHCQLGIINQVIAGPKSWANLGLWLLDHVRLAVVLPSP